MKHIFYICPNVAESLGLEKILNFYNVIANEETDAVEDLQNSGHNVFVSNDYASKDLEKFVENLSYNEKPFILSSIQQATVKLSQLYDWEIKGTKPTDNVVFPPNNTLVFSVYKKGDRKIFGNVHRVFLKDYKNYSIEILDWSKDYISEVEKLVVSLNDLLDGYNTVECRINDDGTLSVGSIYSETLSAGISMFTHAQILDKKSPFVLHEIYDDVTSEDKLSFIEDFNPTNPESQDKSYNITQVNVRSKYETIIKNDFASGIWKYGGDNTGKTEKICLALYEIDEEGDKTLCLLHRGYSLYDIESQEGIAITTRRKDSKVKANDTIVSLKIPTKVLDSNNELFGWVYEIINGVTSVQMN